MRQTGRGPATHIRALECAVTALAVLLAADAIRTALGPVWRALKLLFGI